MSRKDINVIYILGNHDFYLRSLIQEENIKIGDIDLCDEYIHTTVKGERIYLCHGDQFDGFIRIHPMLYFIGDMAYEFSIKINKIYNKLRKIFGMNYWSLSAYLKRNVKDAISYLNDFKKLSLMKVKESDCDSIMIGHIHTPAIETLDGKYTYYNTGDFCESCSYIIEDLEGNIRLLTC